MKQVEPMADGPQLPQRSAGAPDGTARPTMDAVFAWRDARCRRAAIAEAALARRTSP